MCLDIYGGSTEQKVERQEAIGNNALLLKDEYHHYCTHSDVRTGKGSGGAFSGALRELYEPLE